MADSLTGSSAGLAFLDRLLMFVGATLYGVLAVWIFDAFWPGKEGRGEEKALLPAPVAETR